MIATIDAIYKLNLELLSKDSIRDSSENKVSYNIDEKQDKKDIIENEKNENSVNPEDKDINTTSLENKEEKMETNNQSFINKFNINLETILILNDRNNETYNESKQEQEISLKVKIVSNLFNNKQIIYTKDSSILLINTEKKEIIAQNHFTHTNGILNCRFNYLNPSIIVTTGFDNLIKFWNIKNLSEPMYEINNNPHWMLDISFHKTYNRLFLSSSSSSLVRLNIFDQNEENFYLTSIFNKIDYIEFDESVFSVCWSDNDQWLFAAISYNGYVHFNKIPEEVKFKIMIDSK